MACKDCELWDKEDAKDKDEDGRARRTKPARCLWVSTELYVCADDGEDCPCFQERKGEKS